MLSIFSSMEVKKLTERICQTLNLTASERACVLASVNVCVCVCVCLYGVCMCVCVCKHLSDPSPRINSGCPYWMGYNY